MHGQSTPFTYEIKIFGQLVVDNRKITVLTFVILTFLETAVTYLPIIFRRTNAIYFIHSSNFRRR